MRQYSGTDKRDPHAIQKIDAYLKDASVALGKLEATLPDPDPTWYKGEPGEPGEPGDPGPPGGSSSFVVLRSWGDFANYTPRGVAVGSQHHVFVIEDNGVSVWGMGTNINTRPIRSWRKLHQWGAFGNGNGQFAVPEHVAVKDAAPNALGNIYVVYVTDGSGRLQTFDWKVDHIHNDGSVAYAAIWTRTTQFGSYLLTGVAYYNDGVSEYLYVVAQTVHRIYKITTAGVIVTQWGSYGTGNGQFNYPGGIAVDSSGNVYVADRGNNRIQKFTTDGVYLAQIGSHGSGDSQFDDPVDVAVNPSGTSIYVADQGNLRVQQLNIDGQMLSEVAIITSDPGGATTPAELLSPSSIAYYSDSAIHVGVASQDMIFPSAIHTCGLDVVTVTGEETIVGHKIFEGSGYAPLTLSDSVEGFSLPVQAGAYSVNPCILMPGTMMTTVANLGAGDIVIGSAPNVMSALPSSGKDEGDILTISAGVPAWEAPATRLVTQRHEGKTASIASTVLVSKAPPGVYSMYVKLYGLSGSGNVTVTSEWDSGRSTEELVSNFAL
jgi:DNA-binding beta-propeller fold protein YncE